MLVGVEAPEGAPLVAMELLDGAIGPLAEQEIVVQPGAEIAVELHLQSASTIVGRLMAPNHGPVFEAGAFTLVADGPSWLKGRRCISDENGHFESGPLFAGKYTLHSDSGAGPLIHPLELELRLGERRVLDLEVLLAREITVVVEAVCETTGEPWPFPFDFDVNRADELGKCDQESTSRSAGIGLADREPGRVFALRDGPYALEVASSGWCSDASWISPQWCRSAQFTVEAETTEVHVQVTVPDANSEAVSRIDAQLTRPIDDRGGSLRVLYLDEESVRRTRSIDLDPGALRFTLLVDLDHVSSDTIEFAQFRRGEMTAVLLAIELTPGDHSITLTPAVH